MRLSESEKSAENLQSFSGNELLPTTEHIKEQHAMLIQALECLLTLNCGHCENQGAEFAESDAIHAARI